MAEGNLEKLKDRGQAEENLWARRLEIVNIERLKFQMEEQLLQN